MHKRSGRLWKMKMVEVKGFQELKAKSRSAHFSRTDRYHFVCRLGNDAVIIHFSAAQISFFNIGIIEQIFR